MALTAANRRKHLTLTAGTAALVVAVACVAHVLLANYRAVMLDFEPWKNLSALEHPERTGITTIEDVVFHSREGTLLAAWYVPSRNHAAVVITHGTNADRSSMLAEVRILADRGFGVLAFDWPGDGGSDGKIHWDHTERNALVAAVDWLSTRGDVDPQRIGGLGFSMGAYVMAQVASYDTRLAAVVLAAAPSSYTEYTYRLHSKWGPLSRWAAWFALRRSGMPFNDLVPKKVVASISPRPLLLIGGGADPIVPAPMIHALYLEARNPKELWIVPNAHHGGYAQIAPVAYSRRLTEFYTNALLH